MNHQIDTMTDKEKSLFSMLVEKYGLLVDASDAEKLLNESRATLYRKRKQGLGPKFLQDGQNSSIRYPLHEIIHYLCNAQEASNEEDQ
jgi:predicted DNA-binding transcriptional regulator AlpA